MKAQVSIAEGADEAYSLSAAQDFVTLRKDRFVVSVNVNMADPSDQKKLLREVETLVVKAINH